MKYRWAALESGFLGISRPHFLGQFVVCCVVLSGLAFGIFCFPGVSPVFRCGFASDHLFRVPRPACLAYRCLEISFVRNSERPGPRKLDFIYESYVSRVRCHDFE